MRAAMAAAEVGDDVYGEDPTARKLEERSAELLGKEAAIFVPSGTMANQIALLLHCRRGDDVIVGEGAHCMFYESGAGAAWAGVQFTVAGSGGLFTADEMEAVYRPSKNLHHARTRLVSIENTHNRGGGRVFPEADALAIQHRARILGLGVHVDGARIWNAGVASARPVAALAAAGDTVSACFSKGLGAPAGSVLAGPKDLIDDARRYRKMFGGGMRQVGVLCAAALYALDNHMNRLTEDHANARVLAKAIAGIKGIECDVKSVETNIVVFEVSGSADLFVESAKKKGVLLNSIGEGRVRAVTHLDVRYEDIVKAIDVLRSVA